jgi:ribonuclease HI
VHKIEIYTDGAYSSSRNQGGWAFVVLKDGIRVSSGFDAIKDTTNNRMEIQASLEAIKYMREQEQREITIFSDSMYVIGTMSQNWKRKKNVDLWIQMDEACKDMKIEWKHVKGHEGDKFNEMCDMLAVHASHLIIE